MDQWFKLTGKLVYDPVRVDFRKSYKTRTLIVQLPRDSLDLYYQWFLTRQYGSWLTLQRPMYGLHVTVIKGNERIYNENAWKLHSGKSIDILVSPNIKRNWQFWNLPVKSDKLDKLRAELGVTSNFPFHLTIGRQYDWQP